MSAIDPKRTLPRFVRGEQRAWAGGSFDQLIIVLDDGTRENVAAVILAGLRTVHDNCKLLEE